MKVLTSALGSSRSCRPGSASAGPIKTIRDDTERRVYHGYNRPVSSSTIALSCVGVVKRYGTVTAVNGLDLKVLRGECFGLLGPNGAGKTTTIEILEGLLARRRRRGRSPGAALGPRRRRAAPAARHPAAGNAAGREADRCRNAARVSVVLSARSQPSSELLDTVELASKRDCVGVEAVGRAEAAAVGGVRARRASPSCCFSTSRRPGSIRSRAASCGTVLERFRAGGGTILITTHYMDEAHELCDRVGIMDQGKLIALGTPRELVASLGAEHVVEFALAARIARSRTAAVARCRACATCGATPRTSHLSTSEAAPDGAGAARYLRQRDADAEPARHAQRDARRRVRHADRKAVAR